MNRIKAITFDLDGVYFPIGKKEFLSSIVEMGVAESNVDRIFAKSNEMLDYKKGKIKDEVFWSWAIDQWGLDIDPKELINQMISYYEVDKNVRKTLLKLRAQGYKILACSNNFPARINGLNDKFSFLDDFDLAIFSYQVGETKPSEKIFGELIRQAGVEAAQIVLADDKDENVEAAKNIGITAFLYEDFNKFLDQLRQLGIHTK